MPPQALADLVYRDDLTNLYNRRYLRPFLKKHVNEKQTDAAPFSLVMIDLDHFKAVNDTYGHLAGDSVLIQLSDRIRKAVRSEEVVVRYAGDEFMLLMPGTLRDDAVKIAERLRRESSSTPFNVGGSSTATVTLSIGVASFPEDAVTPVALIDAADRAMYHSKQGGRDRVTAAAWKTAATTPVVKELLSGLPCRKLVGRTIALARAESLSNMGDYGPTCLILIQGEAGAGKTRVLREMERRRRDSGHLTMWVDCRPELHSTPYAPILELLRTGFAADKTLQGEVISVLGDEDRVALSSRLPAFGLREQPGVELKLRNPRAAFFTAIVRVLKYLGRERHMCLFLDDIQNADSATLKVIAFLMRADQVREAGIPIFGTVALDTQQAQGNATFPRFQQSVRSCGTYGSIDLRPLQQEHVGSILDLCFEGHAFPSSLAAKIQQVSRGVPLIIEEVLTLLVLAGFISRTSGGAWMLARQAATQLAGTLDELVATHLSRLDDETSGAVLKASVIGSRFSVDLLRKVLGVNEGRAQQLTDKAVRFKLLEDAQTPGEPDRLAFTNRRLQELTYNSVAEDMRRELHRKVADVKEQEPRLDLDQALAEIAHHYEKAGDRRAELARRRQSDRAAKLFRNDEVNEYYEVAGKLAAPRIVAHIAESTTPLPASALALVPDIMKRLIAVQRGVQMYPPGSRYTVNAIAECLKAIGAVLKHAESVTIKDRGGALEINGVAHEMTRWGMVGTQVLRDFRKALVHSLTFTRAICDRDIETLAAGMLRFSERAKGADWKDFMSERRARGIGVIPKRYRAQSGRGGTDTGNLEGLADDVEKHLAMLKSVLRFTAAAAEAVQLYPTGSETVRRAVEGIAEGFRQCHAVLSPVNMGVTAEGFLVNDLRIDTRTFGQGVKVMHDLFERNSISSVSFHTGVQPPELESFFRYLGTGMGLDDAADWDDRLSALGVAHIRVDEYHFIAADAEGGVEEPPEPEEDEREELARLTRQALLQRVMSCPPAGLLEETIAKQLPDLLADLALAGQEKVAGTLSERVFENMAAEDPLLRLQTLDLMDELSRASHIAGRVVLPSLSQRLPDLLCDERTQTPLLKLIELAERTTIHLLATGDMRPAARTLWQLGKGLPHDEEVSEAAQKRSADAVSRVMHSGEFQASLNALWAADEEQKALALHLLESCGRQAADRLLRLVLDSTDDDDVRTFASQLKAVADPTWLEKTMSSSVSPNQSPQRARNVLLVIDQLVDNVFPTLVRAFQHRDSMVIMEAITLLNRLSHDDRRTVLSTLLKIPDPTIRLQAVVLIGDMRPEGLAYELVSLLDDPSTGDALLKELCTALGNLGDARAVSALATLLRSTRWTRLLGKDPPAAVRVGAVWALGNFRTADARAALARARVDHEARVRQAAEAVLAASSMLDYVKD